MRHYKTYSVLLLGKGGYTVSTLRLLEPDDRGDEASVPLPTRLTSTEDLSSRTNKISETKVSRDSSRHGRQRSIQRTQLWKKF